MIEQVLSSIGGVGMYGVISICLFFAVFVGVLIWMVTLKKPYLSSMSKLPLEDESTPETLNDPSCHE
jgi:hypothetical protein